LSDKALRVSKIAKICSRKGNYESPIYLKAKYFGREFPKEGFLDDITIILARRKK
jgi:hypothetical protein